jgi:hypothetical protein
MKSLTPSQLESRKERVVVQMAGKRYTNFRRELARSGLEQW